MSTIDVTFHSLADLLSRARPADWPVAFASDRVYDWQTLNQDVAALHNRLSAHSAQRIALCCDDSYRFAVGFLACAYAGKTLVLPGNSQPAALEELSAQFDLMLHDASLSIPAQTDAFEIAIQQNQAAPNWPRLALEELQLVLFTSGSSGTPKAIHKSLKQLDVEITILQSLWGATLHGTRIESTVSHQHIYGLLFRLLWPLCAGRAFAAFNLEFPEQVIARANEQTTLVSSPALLKRLSEEHHTQPLRQLFSSGGPLSNAAAEHARRLFGHYPQEVYGSTETGGIAHRQQFTASQPWRLFPGVQAKLNSERCLRLRSPHIDPHHWYQTADECYFHDTVTFELRGRTDRIIKIEEKRVSLTEVEQRVEQLDGVSEAVVIPMQEGERLTLVSVIVLSEAGQHDLNTLGKGKFWLALRAQLRRWLEPIAVPRRFRIVDSIPLNSQGKRQIADIEHLFRES
ncbi:class I adenylate-forming enzyme family protein [Vibrio proteolyticus]